MKLDELIKNQYRNLNETEKEILKYLLASVQTLKDLNIKQVAEYTYCQPNTIVRMAKKMGFTGYTDLKHAILYSLEEPHKQQQLNHEQLYKDINQTQGLVNRELIKTIADLIINKQKLCIFGIGASRLSADIFSSRLSFLGISTITFIDQHAMFFYANRMQPGALCLAISYTGEQKGIITPTVLAKSRGATIISLTGISDNELARLSDYQLFFKSSPLYFNGADVTSRIPADIILDHLFNEILHRMNP